MTLPLRRVGSLVMIAALIVGTAACSARAAVSTVVIVQPAGAGAIPLSAPDIPNPLRGQYEDLLIPLFPQGNPAQSKYQAWPKSYDASLRVTWRQLQPADPAKLPPNTPDDRRYDFSAIDRALAVSSSRGLRLTLRVMAYNSCCDASYPNNTNIAIPDWLRRVPGAASALRPKGAQQNITQVVPNWNDRAYLANMEQLLAALGRRYDGDERLSVFEFSGYGDFSENHIAYLRDSLEAPGPKPEDSVRTLGYFSQWRDQGITAESIRRLVAGHVRAFPRTQLMVTPQNPEIVRQMLSEETTRALSAPVGIRSDCLGVQDVLPAWAIDAESGYVTGKDPLIEQITRRLATAPVITEWCEPSAGADLRAYYEKALGDVVKYHVAMTSSVNFADRDAPRPMDPDLFALWAQANKVAGYRYSVRAVEQSVVKGVAEVAVEWTNHGAAAAIERWRPSYQLIDRSGKAVRALNANVDLKALVSEQRTDKPYEPAASTVVEPLRIDTAGLPGGQYTLSAAVLWEQHKAAASHVVVYPPMRLAREGRDGTGWYPIATIEVPSAV